MPRHEYLPGNEGAAMAGQMMTLRDTKAFVHGYDLVPHGLVKYQAGDASYEPQECVNLLASAKTHAL
jgi:hypothetical protein